MPITHIESVVYDYIPAMCTQHEGIPETFRSAAVGVKGCTLIEEHRAQGEGDRWYYDIHFENGTVIRTFNPNQVVFRTR